MRGDSTAPYYEFFAGGGMARLGLGRRWTCAFANDIDPAKARAYRAAFGGPLTLADVWNLHSRDLPGAAAMAWASFPCQDLSLAGARAGLSAPRSGAFWGFWRLIEALAVEARAPNLLVLENVTGLLTSHEGQDFASLCEVLARAGYTFGALTIDAAHFVPQSRPRVFIVAARGPVSRALTQPGPSGPFHSAQLVAAASVLPETIRSSWRWWRLAAPPPINVRLGDVLEADDEVSWRSAHETQRLIELMSPRQRAQVESARNAGERRVGAAFRRIRLQNGVKMQRVEARFDGLAGCLRTPAGGSSRQTVFVIENGAVRSRLLTPRECARLMGAPDDYALPPRANAALHLFGDAVAAPLVRWLAEHLLEPLAGLERCADAA